ncbi:AcrR family transcriptional regulator [Sphingopyxis sp. OAS728]|uniref:TetR/AcrR family transcriptional regulator n=1 Tax=Sphingopyxis sp. OAS728 TaxID=2663823 RepID=UPI00178923FC|nr:TetR/AcrR family transcriptional regulator [Sphingopyxis sp. OAS728]MBE1529923.1 AcrR family transcriptional regulator [Sphingopyxis sp. OAS728]
MAGRTPKNSVEDWIAAGQRMLVDDGIAGLKVDRLASRLGVSRGGFYHHFGDRDDFLDRLIVHWEATCRFLPDALPPAKPGQAAAWLDATIDRLIEADGYDYHFDLAMREWARTDKRVAWAVERADRERLETLGKFFEAIGYQGEHAATRARIFYYHQIGYYAIGVRQNIAERRKNARLYMDILCGEDALLAARSAPPGRARAA